MLLIRLAQSQKTRDQERATCKIRPLDKAHDRATGLAIIVGRRKQPAETDTKKKKQFVEIAWVAEEVIFGKVKEIMASHPLKAFSLLPHSELLWTGPIPTAFIRSFSEAGSIPGTNFQALQHALPKYSKCSHFKVFHDWNLMAVWCTSWKWY